MSKPGFTPGPWPIDYEGVNDHIASVGPIAGYDGDSLDISQADARLVSKAPEMYEALAQLVRETTSDFPSTFPRMSGEVERLLAEIDKGE